MSNERVFTSTLPPLPEPDAITRGFWEATERGELAIQQCAVCGRYMHFPGPTCRYCASTNLSFTPVSGRGEIYSYVVVHHTSIPAYQEIAPYAVAWIELPEQAGLRVLGVIRGTSEVQIGQPVLAIFEQIAPGVTLPFFMPATVGEGGR